MLNKAQMTEGLSALIVYDASTKNSNLYFWEKVFGLNSKAEALLYYLALGLATTTGSIWVGAPKSFNQNGAVTIYNTSAPSANHQSRRWPERIFVLLRVIYKFLGQTLKMVLLAMQVLVSKTCLLSR
jgi:hypothetical protein